MSQDTLERKIPSRLSPCLFILASVIALLFGPLVSLCAQDRLELGVSAGASYYLGDMNPSQQFKNSQLSLGIIGRYNFNDRIAAKATVGYNGIKGAYDDSNGDVYSYSHELNSETFSEGQTVSLRPADCDFKNNLIDISVFCEVNFFSFDHMFRKEQTRFTPYLAVGLGCTSFSQYDDNGDKKRKFVLSLPFGIGAKFKVNKLIRLGLDWTFHKTFTDELENVEDITNTFDAADPYKNGISKLTHNNDWFSQLTVSVTFSMWPRKLACNDGLKTYNRD